MHAKGFTLIELLVVIAIIGLLSSVVLASLNTARAKSYDARRVSDLRSIQNALELYAVSNGGKYPVSTNSTWASQCSGWGSKAANDVIPGLVPTYLPSMPADPQMSTSGNTCCYIYASNGTDYKLLAHNCPTLTYSTFPALIDPTRDSGSNACTVDGTGIWSLAVYTQNACSW